MNFGSIVKQIGGSGPRNIGLDRENSVHKQRDLMRSEIEFLDLVKRRTKVIPSSCP